MKLCQSSSISGPSEIVKPIFEKILMISFLTREIGWRVPIFIGIEGREGSKEETAVVILSYCFLRIWYLWVARLFNVLSFWP